MRTLDYISSVKYYTLLMIAKEEGEEVIEGVVPEGYFAEENEHCPVMMRALRDGKICRKVATDRSLFCDNCNRCFHMRCLKMKKEPKVGCRCEE